MRTLRTQHPPTGSHLARRQALLHPCHFNAIHTRSTCPDCLQDRLLPGPPNADGHPTCVACARIPYDFHCERCNVEAGHHRDRLCARCALRDDLHDLLGGQPNQPALAGLVDTLCAAERPESIIVWKRSAKVQELLRGLGTGTIPVTHEGLDTIPGKPTEHRRAILQHHQLLPPNATSTCLVSSNGSTPNSQACPTTSTSLCGTSPPGTTCDESARWQPPELQPADRSTAPNKRSPKR